MASALLAVASAVGCAKAPVDRVEWLVMGTVAAVQTRGCACETNGQAHVAKVMEVFKDVESRLNAHSPTSELSRLASLPDAEILKLCSPLDRPCYEAAFGLAEASANAFNPRWRGPGTLDLGAIAKGFAVDLAVESMDAGGCDSLIDLGGNLRVARGDGGPRRPWRAGVRAPDGNGFAATVELHEGEALATSATYYRGGHIRDGRTGCVVSNGVASVTVLCGSAMWADGLSTTLFVLGPEEGRAFLDKQLPGHAGGRGVSVLWIMDGGEQKTYGDARFQRN